MNIDLNRAIEVLQACGYECEEIANLAALGSSYLNRANAAEQEVNSLRQQLADAQAEVEEESAIREKLAKLLTETAIALKGEEAALTKHSWHDLAQCATEVINERDDHIKREVMLRDALETCEVEDFSTGHVIHPSFDEKLVKEALAATADLDGLILCEKKPVAWLHENRPEADVITDAVKNVWNGVVVGKMAQYSIPLYAQKRLTK